MSPQRFDLTKSDWFANRFPKQLAAYQGDLAGRKPNPITRPPKLLPPIQWRFRKNLTIKTLARIEKFWESEFFKGTDSSYAMAEQEWEIGEQDRRVNLKQEIEEAKMWLRNQEARKRGGWAEIDAEIQEMNVLKAVDEAFMWNIEQDHSKKTQWLLEQGLERLRLGLQMHKVKEVEILEWASKEMAWLEREIAKLRVEREQEKERIKQEWKAEQKYRRLERRRFRYQLYQSS